MSDFKVTLWGTRGTFVQTSSEKAKYGLETSCISIETKNAIFLIDCGSGIMKFDEYIASKEIKQKKIYILLTHYHHDHINGLGFVNFIHDKNKEVEVFGYGDVYENLNNYFGPPYFPVNILDLANVKTTNIESYETLELDGFKIKTTLLHHPQTCIGYKFITKNKTLTFAIDYEYKLDDKKELIEGFIDGSDFLIIDAFSTEEDYHEGWGHNSVEDAVYLVNKLNIGKCIITHHNIKYNDSKLDEIQKSISKTNDNIILAQSEYSFEF